MKWIRELHIKVLDMPNFDLFWSSVLTIFCMIFATPMLAATKYMFEVFVLLITAMLSALYMLGGIIALAIGVFIVFMILGNTIHEVIKAYYKDKE